ncbi:hypothetical protein DVA86_05930 [Streptomyces armeniacus]|uniref:Uncharacterized protein n=1 Tax=Streptomyces armeniacus TaxID=83291 RepID=A0A345XKU7_9ACTN|nr:hypothetical protein DVA86_05930 [Streptomyces armeniacus]
MPEEVEAEVADEIAGEAGAEEVTPMAFSTFITTPAFQSGLRRGRAPISSNVPAFGAHGCMRGGARREGWS